MVTFTSSVPASHCIQTAPGISFIFKEMILKIILYLLEKEHHCFDAAQPAQELGKELMCCTAHQHSRGSGRAFIRGLQGSALGMSNKIPLLKGQLQSSLCESSPLQSLFCRVSLPKADWRALFDHLALISTFACVPAVATPAFQPYSSCIRANPMLLVPRCSPLMHFALVADIRKSPTKRLMYIY